MPRLSPKWTFTEVILSTLAAESDNVITIRDVVAWYNDVDDETEGRISAVAQAMHFVKSQQGEQSEDDNENGSDLDEEESEDDQQDEEV